MAKAPSDGREDDRMLSDEERAERAQLARIRSLADEKGYKPHEAVHKVRQEDNEKLVRMNAEAQRAKASEQEKQPQRQAQQPAPQQQTERKQLRTFEDRHSPRPERPGQQRGQDDGPGRDRASLKTEHAKAQDDGRKQLKTFEDRHPGQEQGRER
jgi:hypothetical protein